MIMNKNIIISLPFDNRFLLPKVFGTFILFVLLILLQGCGGDADRIIDEGETSAPNVTMTLKSGTDPAFMENAAIYVFKGDDKFVEKKLNVAVNGTKLSTYMPVGNWNLALLTCNTNINGNIILPPYGGNSNNPMWRTKYTASIEEFLSQTPAELRYAVLPNTVITENNTTNKQAVLNRNVAKIQVILKKYTGFDAVHQGNSNSFAFVDLLDVPTTLNWKGGYYPDKNNPENSGNKPIREYFNFRYDKSELVADTVNFIVPAHRGADAFEPVHTDTTTHKLRLRTSMPLNGQSYFGKTPVEISFVPKINRIIQLVVTFSGEPETNLDVKVTVKDWKDVDQSVIFE
jgi:hypothetical protein